MKTVFQEVVGAKVVGVEPEMAPSGCYRVVLPFEDGRKLTLYLDADCCSNSYFTDLKQFDELIGATIQEVEERDGDTTNDGETAWHFLVFTTNKGHVTIDWRNDSNGYYDGNVVPSLETPTAS